MKRKAEAPAAASEPAEGWIRVKDVGDLAGPLFVCINGGEKCLAVREDGEVHLVPVPASHEPEAVCTSGRAPPSSRGP